MNRKAVVNFYNATYDYLLDMVEGVIDKEELKKYFTPDNINCKDMKDVFKQFIKSAQNYYNMPNVIQFEDREKEMTGVLNNYDIGILQDTNPEKVFDALKKKYKFDKTFDTNNSWKRWSIAIVESARFLSQFETYKEFDDYVKRFDLNNITRRALPLLIDKEIKGIGFALACDALKELGYEKYPKPDTHIITICSDLGLSKKEDDYDAFKAVVAIADICSDELKDKKITPYRIDKMMWLISTGNLYHDEESVKGQREKYIDEMKGMKKTSDLKGLEESISWAKQNMRGVD